MYHLSLFLLLKIIFFSTISFSQENNTQEKLVANYASFIMYHRFGDSRYPSTNIKRGQFLQQIDELLKHDLWWNVDTCMKYGLTDELWERV